MPHGVRTYLTSDDWLPLDQRWISVTKLRGKTVGAYGATHDDAEASLLRKLEKMEDGTAAKELVE